MLTYKVFTIPPNVNAVTFWCLNGTRRNLAHRGSVTTQGDYRIHMVRLFYGKLYNIDYAIH